MVRDFFICVHHVKSRFGFQSKFLRKYAFFRHVVHKSTQTNKATSRVRFRQPSGSRRVFQE